MQTESKTKPAELLYLLHADPQELAETVSQMRAADVAESLSALPPAGAAKVLGALPFDLAVQVLEEPDTKPHRVKLINALHIDSAAALLDAMSADERADLFRELSDVDRDRYIRHLGPEARETLELLLRYRADTAGGIMTTEFVAVPASWTVGETLEHVSREGSAKETVYAIYVTDPASRQLVHVVSLRELTMADRSAAVIDVGDRRSPLSVVPLTDREDVVRLISKYDLLAVPVVDEGSRVIGIVTVDDVIDALVREQTEDVQKFGGVQAIDEPYPDIGFRRMIRKRAGWLMVLFVGEMLTASVMGYFEHEIASAVVLALFIPLIISSGGNSGSQATSLIIRAMALREVTLGDWWKVAVRELPTGLTLGMILGIIGVARIVVWEYAGFYDYGDHYLAVALTVGIALLGVVTFGSLAGSMLPFVMRRLGFDPASASAPFVATLVDVSGIVIYFSVAAVLLRGTLL